MDGERDSSPPRNPFRNPIPGPSWSTLGEMEAQFEMIRNNGRPTASGSAAAVDEQPGPSGVSVEEEAREPEEIGGNVNSKIMCKDFVRGHCRRELCKYRHKRDLSQLPGVYTFCRDFQYSSCKYRQCKYVHATPIEENNFYRTGEFPPQIAERVKYMEIPPRRPAHMLEGRVNAPGAFVLSGAGRARAYRAAGRIGVRAYAHPRRPYYVGRKGNRQRNRQEQAARRMCRESVDLQVSIDMVHAMEDDDEDDVTSALDAGRVHALVWIVMRLRNMSVPSTEAHRSLIDDENAGIDISDVPEEPEQRETWITFQINNGLNAGLIYQIQNGLNQIHPEFCLSVARVVSIWLCADLERELTWRDTAPANVNMAPSDESD